MDDGERFLRRENPLPSLRIVLLAGFVLLAPSFAAAATYVVTRTDDPPPGACAVGDCSLREAVLAANATAGTDTIQLPTGTLTITIGEIAVDDDLAIEGSGIDTTILHHALPTLLHVEGAALALKQAA